MFGCELLRQRLRRRNALSKKCDLKTVGGVIDGGTRFVQVAGEVPPLNVCIEVGTQVAWEPQRLCVSGAGAGKRNPLRGDCPSTRQGGGEPL